MAQANIETERAYDVPSGAGLPELGLAANCTWGPEAVDELVATYVDTADLRLVRQSITLRRRTGGTDDGWHLKLPAGGDDRNEIHRALGRTTRVPASITRLLPAATAGAQLAPILELRTRRTRRSLLDADGAERAVIADDHVTATSVEAPERSTGWRELEIEVVGGDPVVFDDLEPLLEKAGIRRSATQSKLRHALDTLGMMPRPAVVPSKSARTVVQHYLAEQYGAFVLADVQVRALDASVHDLRVSARRLRTAVAVYRPLLEAAPARHLQAELKWLGRQLGDLRDLEVAAELLTEAIGAETTRGAVAARTVVRRRLSDATRQAEAAVKHAMGSARYVELLAELERRVSDPPWTGKSGTRATKAIPKRALRARRRLARTVAASELVSGDDELKALHDVRKAAKRVRYAHDLAAPVMDDAADVAEAAKSTQSALGDQLDSVRAQDWLAAVARDVDVAGATFVLGRMHAQQEQSARAARTAYRQSLETYQDLVGDAP